MSAPSPPVVRTVPALRAVVRGWRAKGETVALVPTMGFLHEGHLSLVRLGHARANRVVTSIFVNPTQFAPGEDFEAYPRDEARDAALLAAAGCDLLFAPGVADMYPAGFATTVNVEGVSAPLDGAARPIHFAGVATVVTKLLTQCLPDIALFGEKDYQQLAVIKRLVLDLDLPVEIVGGPTVRNAYLTAAERPIAGKLNLALKRAAASLGGGAAVADVEAEGLAELTRAGFASIDYFEVRAADDLRRLGPGAPNAPGRVFVAARLGKTRLIDNWPV
jgi:pantoate--beta-alanine ligase